MTVGNRWSRFSVDLLTGEINGGSFRGGLQYGSSKPAPQTMTTPQSRKCPACGSDEIEIVVAALVSLVDKKRRLTSGLERFK